MFDFRNIISPILYLSFPEYKTEGDKNYKIDYFEMTENGAIPVYAETDEINSEQAVRILLGGEIDA